ncbi:MAG TPA: DUF1631 family protein [Casimicrobiaceae bacterium]|nr:DUF1631 family protein [Casimicrobiaceae bacterium]
MSVLSPGGRPTPAPGTEPPSPSFGSEEGRALLRELFAQFRVKLLELVRASLEQTNDLFESQSAIPDGEIESFRAKRGEWLDKFDKTLCDLFERRVVDNVRRQGRRPDAEASLATLRVLTAFDHDRQAALKDATRFLDRFTKREIAALDLRIEAMLGNPGPRDLDNPFSVSYILDAVGSSARTVYPSPRVWRPFMERVLSDLTPEINKLYISLNRFLADRGVLPEIKAALRARSEFRPYDDRDLLPTFQKMMHDALPDVPRDIVVPESLSDPNARPALVFADKPITRRDPDANEMSAAKILASLAALASNAPHAPGGTPVVVGVPAIAGGTVAVGGAPADAAGFPSLDPLMALGASTPLFATLAHWQRLDLPTAIAQAAPKDAPGTIEGTVVPLNLIPHIRATISDQMSNETDRITMDVIALLFDYIFRDRSIPDSLRNLFGRLQVPIVKAALLDRTFFSDKEHSARQLLDNLADAAVGATNDEAYQEAFARVSSEIVDDICRDFEIDVAVFRSANAKLAAFIEEERRKVSRATEEDVAAALDAEEGESDRSHVRAFLRDRLAGLDVPYEVRGFIETTWADHMADLRRQHGDDGEAWKQAVATLDDTLWSISAKERSAQKAQLTKMIPKLIAALRKGCLTVGVSAERARAFFEALYQLHIAAIKSTVAAAAEGKPREPPPLPAVNVHDYVSEMAVGTWLGFTKEGETLNARLTWVSPLRTKYLFTSRSRARAFVYTPEELAYEISAGQVTLIVEPVPLFDRAVSAALNELATRQPPVAKAPALAPA